ncbi:MAG: phosphoribosylaminoimidazolesuccinocarboxamide synthase [Deltaproteobacteria bacterium]|nr:MAG: phosphoribosylaminoimidazolesuccinocarboxamide synthase [Deltaproteobacteria bacterium]PIE73366.1 MAG: phosphoribosylaminoimidazolesuccinocarboxamide synthase [Deltaproteobacteria bacterium]
MTDVVQHTDFPGLILTHRGKVRDMYEIPGHEQMLLMVASDRISAYDVVMDDLIPGKGAVLTELSLFWFDLLGDIVENHLITASVDDYPAECQPYREQLQGRSMLVKKTQPLSVECIVRGYISGSFWSAYKKNTNVCGFQLPENMLESEQFPEILFTPSTKAAIGNHDENISMAEMQRIVGEERAEKIADIAKALYERAADYARGRGIIIADTKFEFGEVAGKLILIDEVLTPDSSRFWPVDAYAPGRSQPSFDKQFLRDYLSGLSWDKTPPPPPLPAEIIAKTRARYQEAKKRICNDSSAVLL